MLTKVQDAVGKTHLINLDAIVSIHPMKPKEDQSDSSIIVVPNGSLVCVGTPEQVAATIGVNVDTGERKTFASHGKGQPTDKL